jgi:hypothetical protein
MRLRPHGLVLTDTTCTASALHLCRRFRTPHTCRYPLIPWGHPHASLEIVLSMGPQSPPSQWAGPITPPPRCPSQPLKPPMGPLGALMLTMGDSRPLGQIFQQACMPTNPVTHELPVHALCSAAHAVPLEHNGQGQADVRREILNSVYHSEAGPSVGYANTGVPRQWGTPPDRPTGII